MKKHKSHIGGSFEEFLAEEGQLVDATATAIKRVIAWQVSEAMRQHGMTKAAMARKMGTSRSALERLLDPDNTSVTLHTIQRAAAVIGKRINLQMEDVSHKRNRNATA
jgi:antitoxin HicB